MAINPEKFIQWAEQKFNGDVVVRGNEVKINSVFCEDYKHHLWCNPTGGKKNREHGVFRCWKSDNRGSLISLVMYVEQCDFDEAKKILEVGNTSLRDLEQRLEEFLNNTYQREEKVEVKENKIKLPPFTYQISNISPSDRHRVQAEVYLLKRHLNVDKLMICTDGVYRQRVIIPYYNQNGELIYFNGRYIGTNDKVSRYRGPSVEENGVGKEDVVYMPSWPPENTKIHIVEGEFDALSIFKSGLFSVALGGKTISDKQVEMLMNYRWVLCPDNDKAGRAALVKLGTLLKEKKFSLEYVKPPQNYKDWNEMLVAVGPKIIKAYIEKNTVPFTSDDGWQLTLG